MARTPELVAMAQAAAARHNVPWNIGDALITQESNWDPRAGSSAGASGLMQLMPGTAADMGVTDIWDPAQNLEGGFKYFRWLLDRYNNNVAQALAGYNAGPGRADRYGANVPIAETQNYVPAVLRRAGMADTGAVPGVPVSTPAIGGGQVENAGFLPEEQGAGGSQVPEPLMGGRPPLDMGILAGAMAASGGGQPAVFALAQGLAQARMYANQQQQKFEERAQGAELPSDIRTVDELVERYGLTKEEAIRRKFPSGSDYGTNLITRDGVTYEQVRESTGKTYWRVLPGQEQARREQILRQEQEAREAGKLTPKARQEITQTVRTAGLTLPTQIQRLQRLRDEFVSGKYATNRITGPLKESFDADLQYLAYEQTLELLRILAQVTTGGLSEGEIEVFSRGNIGVNKTPEANIRILDAQIETMRNRYAQARQLNQLMENPEFNPLTWRPEMPELPPFNPGGQPQQGVETPVQSPAGGAAPPLGFGER